MGKTRGCSSIGCIVFREPVDVCVQRVLARTGHPTLKENDEESALIVRRMARDFVFPARWEGMDFCRVVDSSTDFRALATSLSLYK
jgi:hypothetical protein